MWTVIDLWEQNNNTVKDMTLFPKIWSAMIWPGLHINQSLICHEQICIILEHVHMTAFATVLGTFRSQVMQMGDCNVPSMFQQLMTVIFHNCISCFIHVYLDDDIVRGTPLFPFTLILFTLIAFHLQYSLPSIRLPPSHPLTIGLTQSYPRGCPHLLQGLNQVPLIFLVALIISEMVPCLSIPPFPLYS